MKEFRLGEAEEQGFNDDILNEVRRGVIGTLFEATAQELSEFGSGCKMGTEDNKCFQKVAHIYPNLQIRGYLHEDDNTVGSIDIVVDGDEQQNEIEWLFKYGGGTYTSDGTVDINGWRHFHDKKPVDDELVVGHVNIRGFRSIKYLDLDLHRLNVLIGANGSGKSNFIDALALLKSLATGKLQECVKNVGGSEHVIPLDSTLAVLQTKNGDGDYFVEFAPFGKEIRIVAERWKAKQDSLLAIEAPVGDHTESEVLGKLSISGDVFLNDVRTKIAKMYLYRFKNPGISTSLACPVISATDSSMLKEDGSNVAAVLYDLQKKGSYVYANILDTVRMYVPLFDDFVLEPTQSGMIDLYWRKKGIDTKLDISYLSTNSLRFICLTTLLMQPELPSMILLDEPEIGLHPHLLILLASMIRSALKRSATQIFVATQSPSLVTQFEPEDLVIVECGENGSTFVRPNIETIKHWLDDYSLGQIWQKNVIGGN